MSVAPGDILDFWFAGEPDEPATGDRQGSLWWGHDERTDQTLRERFGATHQAAARGELGHWADTAPGRVALVLVLDQLSRNLHRGTPRAFAQDAAARRLVLETLERDPQGTGERAWPFFHRVFFYMPLEHSEGLRDQERSCRQFEALRDRCAPALRPMARTYLGFAYRHRDIVARFGRFPHRNAILGRPSSAEEARFLQQPGSSF